MRTRRRTKQQLNKGPTEATKQKLEEKLASTEEALRLSHVTESERREAEAIATISKNSKFFYTYAKSKQKYRTGVGPLRNPDGCFTYDNGEMANILADQYSSVFSQPKTQLPEKDCIFPLENGNDHLVDFSFTDKDFSDAIDELSTSASAGPDGFPSILLKNCKHALIPFMISLWRRSLNEGLIDPIFKNAFVTPIHKGGDKGLAKNYRPIALTSHVIKIFEKIVRKKLVDHLDKNGYFNDSQHGFRAGRSCLSQLLEHSDNVLSALETNNDVDVIYLDFAKAFDKVDFSVVLEKFREFKISGKVGRWIYDFLHPREQTVVINGTKSRPVPVVSGVPQGSVLGPIIFLVLISDIDSDVLKSFVSSFADDTRVGKSINSTDDEKELQCDLQTIYGWSSVKNMQFNDSKFEHIRYKLHPMKSDNNHIYLSSTNANIKRVDCVRDLGVWLDSDAGYTSQVSHVILKAKRMVSWILRTFVSRDMQPMLTLYKSLVLPILDYCSQLWAPALRRDIQGLEAIQRSFTAKIISLKGLDYWQRLSKCGLYSLERRRERYAIIYCWKIMNYQVPNVNGKIKWHVNQRRGRYCVIAPIVTSSTNRVQTLRENSFCIKGPRLFNKLPQCLRDGEYETVNNFKKHLDDFLRTVPDRPLVPGYHTEKPNSILNI